MPDNTSVEPVSYRDIQDSYNQLQAAGHPAVKGMSMHDYASALNKQTNSNAYDAGLNPNMVKDASAGVDRMLDATGVTDITGGIGKSLGDLISPEAGQAGEQFGRGIVRPVLAGAAGALAGGLVAGPAGAVAGAEEGGAGEAAALAARAAWQMFGSNTGYGANQAVQTYADTDSVPAALASGALGYATHGFGALGESIAARLVGTKIGSVAGVSSEGVLPTLAEMATEKFGLTAGYAVNNEVTRQAVNVAMGRGLSLPTTADAVGEVAQAAAPLILGIGHDIMGVHAAQGPDRDVRSLSESMNVVAAAQKIATDRLKEDVQQTAVAATTTLDAIKKSDAQRAGALPNPTEEEMSGQVLNEEDKRAYADSYLRDSSTGPMGEWVPTRGQTFAGKPLNELGQEATPALSAPINRNEQAPADQLPVTNETQTKAPTAEATPATATTNQQTPAGTPAEVPKVGAPTEQPAANKQSGVVPESTLPPAEARLTLGKIVEKAQLLNQMSKIPTLDTFSQLVDLHTQTQRQLMEYPELRNQISIHPFSDRFFLAQVQHAMSPEGGSLKSGSALMQVLQASKNHLADILETLVKQKPIIEASRTEANARLAHENEAKFVAGQAATEKEVTAKQHAAILGTQKYVDDAMVNPKWGPVIQKALDRNPGVMNPQVAIERWLRKRLLNEDPNARDALQEITDQQNKIMRKLTPEELEKILADPDREITDTQKDNVRFVFNDAGLMWTRTGKLSGSSKMAALLQDNPKNPDHGMWNATLDGYLKTSAEREAEEIQEDGHVSLDEAFGEDGGESTLAHTDLAGDIETAARERHVEPVAVETAKQLGEKRVRAVKHVTDAISKLTPDEIRKIVLNTRYVVPNDLERFKVLLQTFCYGMQREPHELQEFIRTKQPTKITVRGKQYTLPFGLGNWLIDGENGSHTAWQSVGKSNKADMMARCLAFYHEYITMGPGNMPEVNPRYLPGFVEDTKAPEVDAQGNAKAVVAPGTTSSWTDKQKASATMFARPDVDNQLAMGAHSWFSQYLKTLGMDPETPLFARFRDSMVRVSLLFPQIDKTRIGGIVHQKGSEVAGVMSSKYMLDKSGTFSRLARFVNIAGRKFSSPWVATFLQNVVAAHEFNHAIFNAHDMGELGDEMSVKLDNAMQIAKDMSPEDRATILNTIRSYMLPKEITGLDSQEAMTIMNELSHVNDYGAKGGVLNDSMKDEPEEFLSTLFGYLGTGLSNPAKSTENLKNFQRLRQLIPDRLREFQEAYYTNMLQYTKGLQGFLNEYTPGLGNSYKEIADAYQQLARTPKEVDAAMSALHTMAAMQPEQFIQMANDARSPDAQIDGLGTDKFSVTFAKDAEVIYGIKLSMTSSTEKHTGFPHLISPTGNLRLEPALRLDKSLGRRNTAPENEELFRQADKNRSMQFGNAKPKPSVAQALNTVKNMLLPDPRLAPDYGHDPGFWSLFTPLAQFAERYPVMRPLADTLLGYDGMVNSSNALALSPFAMRTVNGKLVKTDNLEALKRLTSNPQTHKLLNQLFLWANKNEQEVTPEIIAKFGGSLSSQQREDVLSAIQATRDSLQTVGQGTITNSLQMSGHLIGSFAMSMDKGMTAKNGEQIGTNVMKALIGLQSKDPATMQQAQMLMGGVKMQLDPESFVHALQLGQTLVQKHLGLMDNLTNRPWYTPETRPHEFGLYYEKDGKPQFFSYKNAGEAMAERDRVSKLPNVQKVGLTNPYDKSAPGSQYSEAAVNHFVSLEQDAFKAAQQAFGGTPDGLNKMQEFAKLYSPGTAILEELGSKGIRKNLQERKFVGGREDIDMLSNALNYVNAMTRANAKNYIRSKTLIQSQDPTLVNEPRLKGLFFDHMNNVLNPPSQSLSALKHLTTMYYIGGNFSSAAMQAFQPIQATLPHLTRNGVGVVQGLKYFADACGTLFNAYGRGKGIQGDPVLQSAFNKATSERVVGFQNVMSAFDHFDDAFVSRVKNFANDSGDAGMTPSKLLQNVSYQTTRVLSYMFQHVTEHNTRVSFIAGFNAARDQGKAKGLVGQDLSDYAYAEAKRTVEESLHTGGQASRPLGFGQVGKLYGVAGNLYALNHFNFSMISIMARYGLEALGHTGLEGAALHNARKAFGQSLVTQLALAGAMGLPFAGATVAMLEELFPNLQLNKDMRTAIAGLAGDDHELGGFLADASLKGMATAVSPVDVSGRLGLSAVLGEDPYYGFEAKDLLGATGSMLYNMTKGVQAVATGDPSGAVKFMPNALQRMYQAAHDNGTQRNAQGQPIFQPTDAQRVLMAIGLRPKELSHIKEQSMIDERDQTIQSRELQHWYQTQESSLTSGNFAAVKAALYQKAQEDSTFSPVIALKRIAAGAQKSQVLQSPEDRGSAAQLQSREATAATFGQPTTSQQQPSQVEQLLARTQLERQVGVVGAGQVSQSELAQARMMDYLMKTYGLSDAQARATMAQMTQQKNPAFQAAHRGAVSPLAALQQQHAGQ